MYLIIRRSLSILFLVLIFQTSCQNKIEFPASLDEMNKPEYLLTHLGPWEINERTHLIFYYHPKLEANINSLIKTHESYFDHITKIIGMSAEANVYGKIFVELENDFYSYLGIQI